MFFAMNSANFLWAPFLQKTSEGDFFWKFNKTRPYLAFNFFRKLSAIASSESNVMVFVTISTTYQYKMKESPRFSMNQITWNRTISHHEMTYHSVNYFGK